MDKKTLFALVHQVNQNLFWFRYEGDAELKALVAKRYNFTFVTITELKEMIDQLNKFDINQIWDKKYMGIGLHESICAVSSELNTKLSKLRTIPFEDLIKMLA